MANNTPQPDNTTQLLGFAAAFLAALAAVINRLPKRTKRKVDTDEYSTVGELVKRDASIEDLKAKLSVRETELQRLEKLEPLARETETLRAVNETLTTYTQNLEKEIESLNAELAALRKLPTRKIEPPRE